MKACPECSKVMQEMRVREAEERKFFCGHCGFNWIKQDPKNASLLEDAKHLLVESSDRLATAMVEIQRLRRRQ